MKSDLAPAEKTHKEIMQIIMKMLYHKLTSEEINRLAELTGYYRGGKGRRPKGKEHLPCMTDASFETPEARKALAERILGRPIWFTLEPYKEGRSKGSKSQKVTNRQAETYEREVESYKEDSEAYTTLNLFESVTDTYYPTNATQKEIDEYDAKIRAFRRDIATGHKSAFHGVEPSIVTSLQNILNKHSK